MYYGISNVTYKREQKDLHCYCFFANGVPLTEK